jgi:nucleotide-binding universal stress UspA family protein
VHRRELHDPPIDLLGSWNMRIRRILAPTDFSPLSLEAVEYAAQVATELRAELAILYVEDTSYALPEQLAASEAVARVMKEAHRAAQHQLARLGERLHKAGLRVHTLILQGPAASRIVEAATKLRADWVVVGTHGRTGAPRAFLGSVAERIVQRAPCPVLVLPSARAPVRRKGKAG